MKKFDIHSAMSGARVITKGGTEVFNIHHLDKCRDPHCVVGVSEYGTILTWTIDGIYGKTDDQIESLSYMDLLLD